MAGRCRVVAGSFFEAIPAGADAYVLKHVLYDWDDARATAILASCRKAMARMATLLIVERVMPEKAEQGRAAEAYLLDLEMLVNTSYHVRVGRTRALAGYCFTTSDSTTMSRTYVVDGASGGGFLTLKRFTRSTLRIPDSCV